MARLRLWLLSGCVLLAGGPALWAGGPAEAGKKPAVKEVKPLDAEALAAAIDRHLAAGWKAAEVQPAPLADDAEFLRRVSLDLAGRIPGVTEVRQFLDDKRPDKRRRKIEDLLKGPNYVNHFANVWRALMLPEDNASIFARGRTPGFEDWLRKQLGKNVGYDKMVRELLTVPLNGGGDRRALLFGQAQGEPTPIAFYLNKELLPENLAAAASRMFLGVKLECAQCHDHPFASWKRKQFWEFTAFFAGVQRQGMGEQVFPAAERPDRREITIPGTEKVVQAKYLDGTAPEWKFKASGRETLAAWMTAADNPYFARAAVNRLWAHFFGHGLIDPVDEMVGTEYEPSHPELLDELARQFAVHEFDLKHLMKAITLSRAYQLTSKATHKSQEAPRQFARMPLRSLTAEQLFDNLVQATGHQEQGPRNLPGFVVGQGGLRDQFLTKFGNQNDKVTESQTSIIQALSLMNGRLTAEATDLQRSELLAAVIDSPFMDTPARVETLYLATLSRKPTAKEAERVNKFIAAATAAGDEPLRPAEKAKRYNQALADVMWTLLNSGEFILNH
jgi:hypothetical protein